MITTDSGNPTSLEQQQARDSADGQTRRLRRWRRNDLSTQTAFGAIDGGRLIEKVRHAQRAHVHRKDIATYGLAGRRHRKVGVIDIGTVGVGGSGKFAV